MVAAVLLVCDFLFDSTLATIVAVGLGGLYIGLWFVFPPRAVCPSGIAGSASGMTVPQPSEPATPAVPEAPVVPAQPDPGTPIVPQEPATPVVPAAPGCPPSPTPSPEVEPGEADG